MSEPRTLDAPPQPEPATEKAGSLEGRRAKALAMGGPEKLAKRKWRVDYHSIALAIKVEKNIQHSEK